MNVISDFLGTMQRIGSGRTGDSVMICWFLNFCSSLSYVGLLSAIAIFPALAEHPSQSNLIKGFSELPLTMSGAGPMIAFGGATELAAVPWLKARGYGAILNLRLDQERPGHLKLMKKQAKANEIEYVHLPFGPATNTDIVPQFIEVIRASANHPLYIHCNSATRAAALWLIYRVLEDGLDFDEAKGEAETIAGRPEAAIVFAERYLSQRE